MLVLALLRSPFSPLTHRDSMGLYLYFMDFHNSTRSEYVSSLLISGVWFLRKISIVLFFYSTVDVIFLGLVVEDTALDNRGHDHFL